MRAVVVVAHPCADSYTHALAAAAVDGLLAAGHHVDVLDLYALGFTAAMSAAEHRAYPSGEPILDPMVAAHAELARRAELLVFVYPTWWSSMPAILKGWLERVMVENVAFRFNARRKVRPALTNVRRIVGISTYGSPWLYVRLINDNGRRILSRALRLSTGVVRTRLSWLALYALDTTTPAERATFLGRVRDEMARR